MKKNSWKYYRLKQMLKLKTYWSTKMEENRNHQLSLFKKSLRYIKKVTFLRRF